MARRKLLSLIFSLLACGCYDQGNGVDPPLDELYFPTGLVVSPGATRLYAISSDFDLQYNAGALHALDLVRIRSLVPQECDADSDCTSSSQHCDLVPTTENRNKPSHWCVDSDGPYAGKPCGAFGEKGAASRLKAPGRCGHVSIAHPKDGGTPILVSSVGIGAFGTDIIYRQRPDGPGGRLFIPVRGDATLHYIDVIDETEAPVPFELSCGQAANDGKCDDNHRRGDDPEEENTRNLRLPPEPFGLAATEDGEALVVTHQTGGAVSLFVNDGGSWGDGVTSFGVGPKLEFTTAGLPDRPIGIAAIPVPKIVTEDPSIPYQPGFLVTFRNSAEVDLLRYYDDKGSSDPRAYVRVTGAVGITANSLGYDSRGIAIDPEPRTDCENACGAGDLQCLSVCGGVQLPVYIANRTPSSLLVAKTRSALNQVSSDELPSFSDSIPLTFGPSKVVVGKVIDTNGNLSTRIFIVCFDTRVIGVYNPATHDIETWIEAGRGPHSLVVDTGTDASGNQYAYAYVGHFTDSYIGVIDLDQRHRYYGTIVVTVGTPHSPRASK